MPTIRDGLRKMMISRRFHKITDSKISCRPGWMNQISLHTFTIPVFSGQENLKIWSQVLNCFPPWTYRHCLGN